MQEAVLSTKLLELLDRFEHAGGVLDIVVLVPSAGITDGNQHRQAAVAAMEIIGRRIRQRASLCRMVIDTHSLAGYPITFAAFWGTDDAWPKRPNQNATGVSFIPSVDGYKTAFFLPPHGVSAQRQQMESLFAEINRELFGKTPENCDIYQWSTDWSNYFDAGHEWWGAYYWTVRVPDKQWFVVIAASTTD